MVLGFRALLLRATFTGKLAVYYQVTFKRVVINIMSGLMGVPYSYGPQ